MAFFGYDPRDYMSNVGQTIAGVGQQIGQTVSQIPQLQQQERLGAQQEESNRLGIESQRFQQKKVEAAEKQLAENPGVLKDYGEGLANDLDVAISNLPEDLRDSVSHIPDAFRKNYGAYGKIKRLSQSEMSGVSDKLRTDFKKQSELIRLTNAVGSGSDINTKNELRAYVAKNFGTITEQQLKSTPGFQGLADDPKVLSAMDKAKLATEKARATKLGAETGKITAGSSKSDLPERKFDELRQSRLRKAEEKIDTEINLVEKDKVKNDAIISAFNSGSRLTDLKGNAVDVTEEMYKQATSDNQRLDTRKETLVKAKEARQKEFMKSGKAGDTFGKNGDVKKVGDYPTNWTVKAFPTSKPVQRSFKKTLTKYGDLISKASKKHGVDEDLILALMTQESAGKANAMSTYEKKDGTKGHAYGLLQITPPHFKERGIPKSKWKDPATNVNLGVELLSGWLKQFGNVEQAIAAYNAGPGSIKNDRWKSYKETKEYVPRIMGSLEYLNSLKTTPEDEDALVSAEADIHEKYVEPEEGIGTESLVPSGEMPTAEELSGESSPVVEPTPISKSTSPNKSKAYHEFQIRRTWGSADIKDKRAILIRLKKHEDKFPELMRELNAELVRELNPKRG